MKVEAKILIVAVRDPETGQADWDVVRDTNSEAWLQLPGTDPVRPRNFESRIYRLPRWAEANKLEYGWQWVTVGEKLEMPRCNNEKPFID